MGEREREYPEAFDKKILGYLPDSEAVERTGFSWPNEININDVFPFTEEKRGVGIGVGIDQMLEILTHSKLDEIVIVDFSPQAHLTTKALLEAGAHYRRLHGTYPSPEIFVSFFSPENIDETIRMVGKKFSKKQQDLLRSQLRRTMEGGGNGGAGNGESGDL